LPDPFDIVVFAASVQYFASLAAIIVNKALSALKPNGGTVHLIDSNFYSPEGVISAALSSARLIIIPAWAARNWRVTTFHHQLNDLRGFRPQNTG
jgi:hypothetical protein